MSEVKLANIDGKELRRELEILFEDKEKRVFFMQMLATSVKENKRVAERGDFDAGTPGNITESRVQDEDM